MINYLCHLFDADGTLIDTAELIYQSYVHVISRFNGKQTSREKISTGIVKPLAHKLHELFSEKKALKYYDGKAQAGTSL